MEEINNFQQEPDETLYQAWERFKELLMKCPQHYLTEMQEVILFYNGLEVPTRQILDSKGAIPSKTAADAKELATVKYPKEIAKNLLVGIGKFLFLVDFIILDMPEDVKVPLILERPFLSTPHSKIDVFKRKITLRVRDEKIIFKSVKPASSLIKRVYMLILRERMELDLEARLMGETLVLNRSLDPLHGDYIELNDLNVPLELREFYNSIIKDKVEYKGKNVVGAFMNVPIFVGNFSVVTHFAVVENMDGYRDQDMGDVILGRTILQACV
ncbi:hypothetical protein Tco_0713182 [Tanacetum coccineum]